MRQRKKQNMEMEKGMPIYTIKSSFRRTAITEKIVNAMIEKIKDTR
jgi:hypothetical protein